MNFRANGECGTFVQAFGANPRTDTSRGTAVTRSALDASGNPVGLATTQCGRRRTGHPGGVQAYCAAYGDTLLEGWGKRQNEWQLGIGIQHEILPRLSGEVTYNRRNYSNLTSTDTLGIGCDRFNGAAGRDGRARTRLPELRQPRRTTSTRCIAPTDPRLPGGGGYRILGLNTDEDVTAPVGQPQAQTIDPGLREHVQRLRHELRVARAEGHPRQRWHQHRPPGAEHLLRDGRQPERARP